MVADFIVNELDRKPMGFFTLRDGNPFFSPIAGVYGPKVMMINESAGSGGDALPFCFKLRKLGPLVGTRTWGGLVGTLGVPPQRSTAAGSLLRLSLSTICRENRMSKISESLRISKSRIRRQTQPTGNDPQLERAVAEAMKLIGKNPLKRIAAPGIDRPRIKTIRRTNSEN